MNGRAIQDITNFIFMEDAPEKCDIILLPGTSKSAVSEQAAALYRAGECDFAGGSGNQYHGKRHAFRSGAEGCRDRRKTGDPLLPGVFVLCLLFSRGGAAGGSHCNPGNHQGQLYQSEQGYRKVLGEVAKCGAYFREMGVWLAQEELSG